MRYENIKDYDDKKFKRLTGVKKETFEKMVEVLEPEFRDFGRPRKLTVADQLLLTLTYWREYRTQFHIAGSYDISEATVCRIIQKVEKTLMASGEFRLPGKKKLRENETLIEVVIVDVAEQPIERPKKSKNDITVEKRNAIPKKHK
jgi:hypothetical protein